MKMRAVFCVSAVALAAALATPLAHAAGTVSGAIHSDYLFHCDATCSSLVIDSIDQDLTSPTGFASLADGSFGRSAGAYSGSLKAPLLRAWASSVLPPDLTEGFVGAQGYVGMLQGYTWTGDAQEINWEARLNWVSPVSGFRSDVAADFWLLDASFVPANDPFQRIFPLQLIGNNPLSGEVIPCDGTHPGILGYSKSVNRGAAVGAGTATLSLGSTCAGTPFVAQPGQQFYLYATLQALAYNGGEMNAFNSLRVGLSPDTSAEDLAAITRGLTPSPTPEPATWAMIVLGFGALGGVLRRRRSGIAWQ